MNEIKTPVFYSTRTGTIYDGKGRRLIVPVNPAPDGHLTVSVAEQICNAINEAAALREMLKLTIQCFNDLESDVAAANATYEPFPMATKVMADARALLEKTK